MKWYMFHGLSLITYLTASEKLEEHILSSVNVFFPWHMNCASIIKNILWQKIIGASLQGQTKKKDWE